MHPKSTTTCEIPLTRGKVAVIDATDFERVSQFKWYAVRPRPNYPDRWYAARSQHSPGRRQKMIYLHRFILDASPTSVVDHLDGDGLNCTRANMRHASQAQNSGNRAMNKNNQSGYKGIYWDKATGKWRAEIRVNNKGIKLGRFVDPELAARAYDEAAKHYFGPFAYLNFPNE